MNKVAVEPITIHADFSNEVMRACGQVNVCYQCGKCSAGCPVAYEMDYFPNQIIHAVRLGLKDLVLNSRTIWLCASCETCTTRCPQEVDLAKVMDCLRVIANREKIRPGIPQIPAFYWSALQSIRMFGRLYELGLISLLKLRTREFMRDTNLGIRMIRKGKLKLLPSIVKVIKTNKIFLRSRKMEKAKP